jgi:catechol 2,3-dioxygenase-like lactoylglutathione lyase family enzyme
MPRHHHVNLAVPPGGVEAEISFLVDVLGYSRLELTDAVREIAPGAKWFEAEDGSQIHLSEDEGHRPADRAHVAVEFDEAELTAVRGRLESEGMDFTSGEPRPGFPATVFLRDPGGNRWELRGTVSG